MTSYLKQAASRFNPRPLWVVDEGSGVRRLDSVPDPVVTQLHVFNQGWMSLSVRLKTEDVV